MNEEVTLDFDNEELSAVVVTLDFGPEYNEGYEFGQTLVEELRARINEKFSKADSVEGAWDAINDHWETLVE